MSSERSYLALRLEGPLQAWGFDSQYNRRNTGLMPTKSAIAGICCAALGYGRGSDQEQEFLVSFVTVRMTTIVLPRVVAKKGRPHKLAVRRLQDYHTVQNTMRASGTINKDCVLTHRQYLADAFFGVMLEGEKSFLERIADGLNDPVWGIWLGRKACIPTAPIFVGLKSERDAALKLFIGDEPLKSFTRQEEVKDFSEGKDSLPDVAISFQSGKREFSLRRVRMLQAGEAD